MANKRPDLLDKIILANLMAPVAFVDHMKSPLRLFAPYAYSLQVSSALLVQVNFVGQNLVAKAMIDEYLNFNLLLTLRVHNR